MGYAMFTGIIQHIGSVVRVTRAGPALRLAIDLGRLAERVARGDSVAIDGVCLTVASKSGAVCEFDAVPETLSRTTLPELRPADRVNLEAALRAGDPIGGQFVLGHVDGLGSVQNTIAGGREAVLRVRVEPALAEQMVPKGSVALDGVSLTLVDVARDQFSVALIPTTLADTTLGAKPPGSRVNIETDILAKHVLKLLRSAQPGLTIDKLRDSGFV